MYIYVLSLKLTHSTLNRMRFYCKYSFYLRFRGCRSLFFLLTFRAYTRLLSDGLSNKLCVFFFLLFFFVFVRFGTLLCANQSVLYVRCVCICMFHNDDVGLQFYELKRVRISNGPISFHSHSYIEPVAISNSIYIYIRTDTKYSRA